VLGIVSLLAAAPDLRQLLTQTSRISNEATSLAQALSESAAQAEAVLRAPDAAVPGGDAARHAALLVAQAHAQVQVSAARLGG
jgi:archaellum component FlaG (FlaF/FlaG flagellin family)